MIAIIKTRIENAFKFESSFHALVLVYCIYFTGHAWSLDYQIELHSSTLIAMVQYCFHNEIFLVCFSFGFRFQRIAHINWRARLDRECEGEGFIVLQVETGAWKFHHKRAHISLSFSSWSFSEYKVWCIARSFPFSREKEMLYIFP